MSGNIRKQLGPVKKRLEDRIAEVQIMILDEDRTGLRNVPSKLTANIKSHEELTSQLSKLVLGDEDEAKIIEDRLEMCSSLNMDAKEAMQAIDDCLAEDTHKRLMTRDLSKCDKFKYLMSCLSGEAKDTLVGFKITEGQSDAAVELLEERYDGKQFIIHSHYEAMTNMSRSNKSTNNLRRTFNQIETHIRSLESMNEVIENNQLVSLVKSKFPQ